MLIFNVAKEWNNVVIAIMKHHFLSFCIIFFQKKKKSKEKNIYIKIKTKRII
jgi:hypothetical protein